VKRFHCHKAPETGKPRPADKDEAENARFNWLVIGHVKYASGRLRARPASNGHKLNPLQITKSYGFSKLNVFFYMSIYNMRN
jgi:hypothetical protein